MSDLPQPQNNAPANPADVPPQPHTSGDVPPLVPGDNPPSYAPNVPVQHFTLQDGRQVDVIGNVQQDARFDFAEGQNTYGVTNDNGIVAARDVLAQHGISVDEDTLLARVSQDNPGNDGSVTTGMLVKLFHDYNVPAQSTRGTASDLNQQIESGATTILSVDQGVWDNNPNASGQGIGVEVTGVVRDSQSGQIVAYVVNDPTNTDQGTRVVSAGVVQQAWSAAGNYEIVIPPASQSVPQPYQPQPPQPYPPQQPQPYQPQQPPQQGPNAPGNPSRV